MVQDARFAAKKAGRRATDPRRDGRAKATEAKRPAKAKPQSKPAAAKPEKASSKKAGPERKREPVPKPARARGRGSRRERARRRRGARAERRRARVERRRTGERRKRRIRGPSGAKAAAAVTRFGERSSRVIRSAVATLAIPLIGLASLGRKGLAWLAKFVTPLRAALAATAIAAIILGISQFVDYRGVAVGVPDYAAYSDAEVVAPAPQVDRQPAGSAHAYLLLPLAAVALVLLALTVRGHWRLGRVVSLLGVLAIAVTLVVDVPTGLDEGAQAVAYAGVEARLIEGFWIQLFSAAVLLVGGLLVSRYARRSGRREPRPRRRSAPVGTAPAGAA